MDEEEFYRKEDFLDTLKCALDEAKDVGDKFYISELEYLIIDLEDELNEVREKMEEQSDAEKRQLKYEYYNSQL